MLLDLAGVGQAISLLDVVTGPRTLIGPALGRGADMSAVDVTPEMVEWARQRHPGVEIAVAAAKTRAHQLTTKR